MHATDQQGSLAEACPASGPVSWLRETASENLQPSYYRARYYDTQTGRFLAEASLGPKEEGPNMYTYVSNNPIISVDPLGRYSIDPRFEELIKTSFARAIELLDGLRQDLGTADDGQGGRILDSLRADRLLDGE